MKLKTETNTPAMGARILRAAHKKFRVRHHLTVHFEHGQWWLMHTETGAAWSVVDAEGGPAIDGFDFEQVAEGEEA